ncbi:MAG: isopentenyl phosphate kinase [Chloroflexota bacterium]
MSGAKPIILKIGGSAITDKTGELAAKTEVINRLAEEIKRADLDNLIVVHGGGSFGHPTAKKYDIKEGYKEASQKLGFAETHHVMTVLNGLVMDSLIWHEIPAVSIAPSGCMTTENGRINSCELAALRRMMDMNFTPVFYGDVVFDDKLGFTVLSGDQIVAYLALKLGACKVIIGADTDGLYNADPKVDANAKPYKNLSLQELKNVQKNLSNAEGNDVTGGMAGKVAELIPVVEQGIPVTFTGATRAMSILRALAGQSVAGTEIRKA